MRDGYDPKKDPPILEMEIKYISLFVSHFFTALCYYLTFTFLLVAILSWWDRR